MRHPRFPLTVFYDGSCIVCDREVNHYYRRAPQGALRLVDISSGDFDPTAYGKSREDFMAQLHVLDAAGRFYVAVDGFWAIWQAFPASSVYGILGRLVRLPFIEPLARLGYRVFARLRKYLPKTRSRCDDGSCPLDHRK